MDPKGLEEKGLSREPEGGGGPGLDVRGEAGPRFRGGVGSLPNPRLSVCLLRSEGCMPRPPTPGRAGPLLRHPVAPPIWVVGMSLGSVPDAGKPVAATP